MPSWPEEEVLLNEFELSCGLCCKGEKAGCLQDANELQGQEVLPKRD